MYQVVKYLAPQAGSFAILLMVSLIRTFVMPHHRLRALPDKLLCIKAANSMIYSSLDTDISEI